VASQSKEGQVIFKWYTFQREVVMQGKGGRSNRDFFGNILELKRLKNKMRCIIVIIQSFLMGMDISRGKR